MTKKILLILLVYITSLQLMAQTKCDCFERLSNLADLKSFENKTDSALITYKRALTFLPSNARNYSHDLTLGTYFLENSDIDSSAFYLKKAIEGGYPINYIKYNVDFDSLINSTYWEKVESSYHIVNSNFNWTFYNKIQRTLGIDQAIRGNTIFKSIATDSIEKYTMFYLTDSSSLFKITEQINLHGYPSQLTHGFIGEKLMVFFMHSSMYSKEMYDKINTILIRANLSCLCKKSSITMLNDRRLEWYYEKKQIAGTWNYGGEFNPIENLEKVDSIRFNYNLLTLFDYGRSSGRTMPKGYVKTDYPDNYFCK